MPIYEYRCPSCGETFARLQRMEGGAPSPPCPKCGDADTRRILSSFSAAPSSASADPSSAAPCRGGGG